MSVGVLVGTLALGLAACSGDTATAPAAEPTPLASLSATNGIGPQRCTPDSKLIGLTTLSTADEPGTWWYITREGLDAAGITDYLAFMESVFGRDFDSLDEAIAFVVDAIRPLDVNANGVVCAYESRGTRTSLGLPDVSRYTFTVLDDRLVD
jgi:hypothetical protein